MFALSNLGRYGCGLAGLVIFAVWQARLRGYFETRGNFSRWALAFWFLSRVLACLLLYRVLHQSPPTDVAGYYVPQAQAALQGGLPYRDFPTSFAPLFPFLLAAMYAVWASPWVFIAASILLEGFLLAFWLWQGPRIAPPAESRQAIAAYLCSILPLNTVVMGQDEPGVALLLSLALAATFAGRQIQAGVATGLLLVLTKFTSLLYVPLLSWHERHRSRFLLVIAVLVLPVYGWVVLRGGDPLLPLKFESGLFTNGNLPFLLSLFFPQGLVHPLSGGLNVLGVLLALAFLYFALRRHTPPAPSLLLAAVSAATLIFLLLFKKSFPVYLEIIFLPLCLCLAAAGDRWLWLLLALSILSVTQSSLFFRLLHWQPLAQVWSHPAPLSIWLFALVDLLVFTGYAMLAVRVCKPILAKPCN